MASFDLLNYMNDDSLIATLGLEPVSPTDDSYAKLLGTDANTYIDLLPPPAQQLGNYNSVTGNTPKYYTIDTDAPSNNSVECLSQPASLPVEFNTTEPIPLTIETVQNSSPTWEPMEDPSVIILSSTESESDAPFSIAIQNPISNPVEPTGNSLQMASNTEAQIEMSPKPARKPRRRRPKKEKIYEIKEKFEDPVKEKKRLNAINAKKNRDKKKDMLNDLRDKVSAVTKERDELEREVTTLKEREKVLRQQLQAKYGVRLPVF